MRLLSPVAARFQGEPLRLGNGLAMREDVLKDDVKLAHVVLPKAVLVPAGSLEQQVLLAHDGHFERCVPFGVQGLVDGRGGLLCIAERHNKVLHSCCQLRSWGNTCTARQSCVCTWACWRGGYSLGLKCHSCPLQPDSCPASVSGCSFSSAGHWNTHLDHVRPQHQARLNVAHGSFGAALSTRGDAVDRGAAVVLLQTLW